MTDTTTPDRLAQVVAFGDQFADISLTGRHGGDSAVRIEVRSRFGETRAEVTYYAVSRRNLAAVQEQAELLLDAVALANVINRWLETSVTVSQAAEGIAASVDPVADTLARYVLSAHIELPNEGGIVTVG